MHAFLLLAALCADPDIESMKRSLESQISALQRINTPAQKGGDPTETGPSVPAQPDPALPQVAPEPLTAVCQCQGSNRGVCFCLQNRVQCKCNSSKGSVWNLNEAGRAVSKTGQYADPRKQPRRETTQPLARSHAPAASVTPRQVVPAPVIQLPWVQPSCPNCRNYRSYRRDDD